jgi:hypothetical protein
MKWDALALSVLEAVAKKEVKKVVRAPMSHEKMELKGSGGLGMASC